MVPGCTTAAVGGRDNGPMGLSIRSVRPGEYEEAGRVVVEAYEALPGAHLDEVYAAELCDVARRAIEAEVYVAVRRELVGCVTLVPDASSPWAELLEEGEAGIRMLAVRPAEWGRGIGRSLLDFSIARARHLGKEALLLHSTPWMEAAHHLYATAGFEREERRDWLPVPEVPLLAFRLAL